MEDTHEHSAPVMSTTDWLITILLTTIPLVNIIMLFIWAFGTDANPNKKNYAKATLIWFAIMVALYLVLIMIFGAAYMSALQ